MTQVLEKIVARNIEESELIAASVSPREYQNISISCNTCRRAYTRIWKAYVRPPLRKLRKLGPRWKRATSGGRRLVARGGNRGMKGRTERAEGMQMESYTAEKRILNQQLGRRRANRVDACLPACFSSLGQRRWQSSEICMRICLRFYVLSPSLLTPPPPVRYGDDRRNSIKRILFSPSISERKVRRGPTGPPTGMEIQIFVRRDSPDLKF